MMGTYTGMVQQAILSVGQGLTEKMGSKSNKGQWTMEGGAGLRGKVGEGTGSHSPTAPRAPLFCLSELDLQGGTHGVPTLSSAIETSELCNHTTELCLSCN